MDPAALFAIPLARLSPGMWAFLIALALLAVRALIIRLLSGR